MTFQNPALAEGRYARSKLDSALEEVCSSVGLDCRGAQLLRFVNNGVYLLARHPVVVRIVLAPSVSYRADSVVEGARWLARNDMPVVRLLPGVQQPVRVGGHIATFWEAVDDLGHPQSGGDMGALLRRLHSLPLSSALPEWRPMADTRNRLNDAEELNRDDRYFLEKRCDEVEEQLARLRFPLARSVVHGDAHLGNVIPSPDGPVLCDLDSLCVGPPEWDLTPMAVGWLRMGHPPERYGQLADSYGFDITRWQGFQVLRDLRELKITVSVLPILRSNPDVRDELHHRLGSMRRGDVHAQWSPYR